MSTQEDNKRIAKEKARLMYETNAESDVKQISDEMGVPVRTLYHWIKFEGWERGKHEAKASPNMIRVLDNEVGTNLRLQEQEIASKLGGLYPDISSVVIKAHAKRLSDSMVTEIIGAKFINEKIAETSLIAQQAFQDYSLRHSNDSNKTRTIISMAKDVVGMYALMKDSIHGKNATTIVGSINNINEVGDITQLSDSEIIRIIESTQKKELENDSNDGKKRS